MVVSIIKVLGCFVLLIIVVFFSILIYRAFKARAMPDLQKWHNPPTSKDNLTRNSYDTFSDYLAKEKEFLEKIYKEVEAGEGEGFNRYIRKNICSPYKDGNDLNSSFHLFPPSDNRKGGILLIHGLTDSPYHLRAIAEIFAGNGYYVICLRLPGHGTTPGALLDVKWEDWYAAVKFGAELVRNEISKYKEPQFFVGGFSTGGALTLKYVLDNLTSGAPDKLFLFSPAVGVSWFAEFAGLHKLVSWIPGFKKFKWKDIKPEYDPCKYNSFPKNAGAQIHELTMENKKLVKKLVSNPGKLENMPMIYAFQSVVDATVITGDLVDLMDKIGTAGSELVLFDINRNFNDFINTEPADNLLDETKKRSDFRPRLIVVPDEGESDGELKWPEYVFALSHVCMPISPEDEYYGRDSISGRLNVKGEKKILVIDPSDLIRIRYNPFFTYIKTRIEKAISDGS